MVNGGRAYCNAVVFSSKIWHVGRLLEMSSGQSRGNPPRTDGCCDLQYQYVGQDSVHYFKW